MSYLQKQMNLLRYDKRLLEINISKGNITQTEYDQHISELPDDTANTEKLVLESDSAAQSAPAQAPQQEQPVAIPQNTDPFGSGF